MTRWKASATHFAISLVVIGVIAAIIVWRWYPLELFGMAKAGGLLSILLAVDLVLGPLLTAVVFRSGKPGLKFDLAVIGLLQVAALFYGLFVMWQSRPVYLVATSDRFHLVFAHEIDAASAAKAPPAYRDLPLWGPEVVAAPLPTDPKQRLEAMILAMSGSDIQLMPGRYAPYPARGGEPLQAAIPAAEAIAAAAPAQRAAWQAAFGRYRDAPSAAMLPLQSSRGDATLLIDGRDGRILGYADLDPWPILEALESRREVSARARTP
jgi:hypothetical protein